MIKKILIAYSSKTGTTKKVGEILKDKLKGNIDLVDLKETTPNLDNYDLIIIGGPIRASHLKKETKKFINNNKDILLSKKYAMFICCSSNDKKDIDFYFTENFDESLLKNAIVYNTFGGEMDINKQNGLTKILINLITKSNNNYQPNINYKNIEDFAKIINGVE